MIAIVSDAPTLSIMAIVSSPPKDFPTSSSGWDGRTACAGCPNDGVRDCVATSATIGDAHCARCATGQAWWPCDLADECHCRDPPAYDEDAVGATPAPDPTPGTGWPHPTVLEGAAVGSQVSQGSAC